MRRQASRCGTSTPAKRFPPRRSRTASKVGNMWPWRPARMSWPLVFLTRQKPLPRQHWVYLGMRRGILSEDFPGDGLVELRGDSLNLAALATYSETESTTDLTHPAADRQSRFGFTSQ